MRRLKQMENIEFSRKTNEFGTVNSIFKLTYFSSHNYALGGEKGISQLLV